MSERFEVSGSYVVDHENDRQINCCTEEHARYIARALNRPMPAAEAREKALRERAEQAERERDRMNTLNHQLLDERVRWENASPNILEADERRKAAERALAEAQMALETQTTAGKVIADELWREHLRLERARAELAERDALIVQMRTALEAWQKVYTPCLECTESFCDGECESPTEQRDTAKRLTTAALAFTPTTAAEHAAAERALVERDALIAALRGALVEEQRFWAEVEKCPLCDYQVGEYCEDKHQDDYDYVENLKRKALALTPTAADKCAAAERERQIIQQSHEIEQVLGKALGYPLAPTPPGENTDIVCVGDHTPESLADETARRLGEQRAQVTALRRALEWAKGHISKIEVDYLGCDPDVEYINDALALTPTAAGEEGLVAGLHQQIANLKRQLAEWETRTLSAEGRVENVQHAIEEVDSKLTSWSTDGEWTTCYGMPAGPWHKLLGLVRGVDSSCVALTPTAAAEREVVEAAEEWRGALKNLNDCSAEAYGAAGEYYNRCEAALVADVDALAALKAKEVGDGRK